MTRAWNCMLLTTALLVPGAHSALKSAGSDTKSGFIETDGGRLFYEETGQGEAMILLHDGLLHRETWSGQWEVLARSRRVIRYDRRGYGRSPQGEGLHSDLKDLEAVYRALHVERAVLMGCSAGGRLAVDFALAHPERVAALVLVGPVVRGAPYTPHLINRGERLSREIQASPEAYREYWFTQDPFNMAPENTAAREGARRLLMANPHNARAVGGTVPAGRAAVEALQEIAVPVLILVGEFDIPDVHAHTGILEWRIRGAHRIVIPHAGHLVHLEQPALVNREVEDFLKAGRFLYLLRLGEVSGALQEGERLRKGDPKLIPAAEEVLNQEGYRLLGQGRTKEAIQVFRLNVEWYPASWNVYDSLGEALVADGQREAGIMNYQKSLELNPANSNAVEVLKTLESSGGKK